MGKWLAFFQKWVREGNVRKTGATRSEMLAFLMGNASFMSVRCRRS